MRSLRFLSFVLNNHENIAQVGAAAVKPAPAAGVPLSPKPKAVVLPPVPPEGDTFQLILSVIFNPSEFYGHLTTGNSDHGLEELQEQLNQLGMQASAPAAEEVTEGTFWACPYGPDRSWYRVRVVEVLQGVSPVSTAYTLLCLWEPFFLWVFIELST